MGCFPSLQPSQQAREVSGTRIMAILQMRRLRHLGCRLGKKDRHTRLSAFKKFTSIFLMLSVVWFE